VDKLHGVRAVRLEARRSTARHNALIGDNELWQHRLDSVVVADEADDGDGAALLAQRDSLF